MSKPPDAALFRALETARTQALVHRDLPLMDRLHAPEYQLVTPAGKVFTREAYFAALAEAPFYAGWQIGELQLRLGSDMALLRYPATLTFPSGRIVVCWHLDAYELRGPQWQAVWSQATEIRAPAEAPAA